MITKLLLIADGVNAIISSTDVERDFRVTGTTVLTSNWSVGYSGTPYNGEIRTIRYVSKGVTLGGNAISFLGASMPDEYVSKDLTVICEYNGTSWVISMIPDFDEDNIIDASTKIIDGTIISSKIGDKQITDKHIADGKILEIALGSDSVTTLKIKDGTVKNSKLENANANTIKSNPTAGAAAPSDLAIAASQFVGRTAASNIKGMSVAESQTLLFTAGLITPTMLVADLLNESRSFIVSFETGEQCNNRFRMPFKGYVNAVYGVVVKAIAITDAGTVILKDAAGTSMTGGTLTFAASDPLNTAYSSVVTGNNTFNAGDILYATTAKATVGGKVLLTVELIRTV
jgi:hypothetical protein